MLQTKVKLQQESLSSSCGTSVDHTLSERGRGFESRWVLAFFFSSPSYPESGTQSQQCNTTDFPLKLCLAMQLEVTQA